MTITSKIQFYNAYVCLLMVIVLKYMDTSSSQNIKQLQTAKLNSKRTVQQAFL